MTDLHLIALLKKHGWKLHTRSTLRNWTKERLIDEIECLENNWGVSLEREEISFGYKKKLVEENQQLKQQIEKLKCCGYCVHRNAEEVVETCRKNKTYTLIKGSCEWWELEE